jgi:citrate lyase subunit beta/citryl-CoA lyase
MPGSNARAIEKARSLPVDSVILDLEDAVAPDLKERARDHVVEAVRKGGFGGREIVIRVNGATTPWGAEDLRAATFAAPDAILLPKISNPATLLDAGARLSAAGAPATTRIWAMIETPAALLAIERIAAAARDPIARLACFVMGTNDLAKETRARLAPGRAAMVPWLMQALAAARAEGLDIVDGVYNDIADETGFRAECAQGRDFGFDGKTLIHPSQIAAANEIFAPTNADIAGARAIIDAFARPENAGKGAITLDGRMVERLHADIAARTVALAEAIAGRG